MAKEYLKEFISEELIELLQYRIQMERASAYLYEAMSHYLANRSLSGAAALWDKFAKEEVIHADKAEEFLMSFNIVPQMRQLDAQPYEFEGLGDIIMRTFEHEQEVSRQCITLAKAALQESNLMVYGLGQFYVNEQVEELSKCYQLIDLLEQYGESAPGLGLLDKALKKLV